MLWILYVKVDWGIRPRALTVCVCVSWPVYVCVCVCAEAINAFRICRLPQHQSALAPEIPRNTRCESSGHIPPDTSVPIHNTGCALARTILLRKRVHACATCDVLWRSFREHKSAKGSWWMIVFGQLVGDSKTTMPWFMQLDSANDGLEKAFGKN